MNGMLSPLPMPVNQTLVPTGGYGTGTNYIPMGARMLTPSGGYATQPMMMPSYNPYIGMFSQYIQQPTMPDLYYQGQINPSSGSEYATPAGNAMFTPEEFLNLTVNFIPGVGFVRNSGRFLNTLFGGDSPNEGSGGSSDYESRNELGRSEAETGGMTI